MSHLSRRYTEFYYAVEEGKEKFVKKQILHVNSPKYIRNLAPQGITVPMAQAPNANFPCKHEKRDFMSKKRQNHTHARMKRRNKARIRARKN